MSVRCRSARTSRRAPGDGKMDDLETMLLASRRLGVPMIVGSAGDTGSNSRVDLFVGIIEDLAEKHRLARFRVGYFYSEVGKEELRRRIAAADTVAGRAARPPRDLARRAARAGPAARPGHLPYTNRPAARPEVPSGAASSAC